MMERTIAAIPRLPCAKPKDTSTYNAASSFDVSTAAAIHINENPLV